MTQAANLSSFIPPSWTTHYPVRLFPVPRGGVFGALLIKQRLRDAGYIHTQLTVSLEEAHFIIDDICDSGKTKEFFEKTTGKPFFSLYSKADKTVAGEWFEFPWETMTNEIGPEENVRRILQWIGEDPEREGLQETPKRVIKAYKEIFAGYHIDPKSVFKTFEEGACDEMVILKDIEFWSTCEHHMAPFFGTAHVAYIPNGRVIGVSKLARLVDIFAQRLQIQERICQQVADALMEYLTPKGAACVIEARHLCMTCRGVRKQNSKMISSSLRGEFLEAEVRAEFMSLIH